MIILVCGDRNYTNEKHVFHVLNSIEFIAGPITLVVHGDAPGADSLADAWAKKNNKEVDPNPADWKKHGKAAGPLRNGAMLKKHPDIALVVAFNGGGPGTRDMIRRAEEKGITVLNYPLELEDDYY